MTKIFVTGANGFLGDALVKCMCSSGKYDVRASIRKKIEQENSDSIEYVLSPSLNANSSWFDTLQNIDCVVHAAARVHFMGKKTGASLGEFRKVNVEGTLKLARDSAKAGVKRFIFISSIKVNGEGTESGAPYRASDEPAPLDPYGISKFEAEKGLLDLAKNSDMSIVIIRPVMMYGANAKGNFNLMLKWVNNQWPLPFGAIHNKRSFVALDNVVDLILRCIDHPAAANEIFLVSDDCDLSTPELLSRVGLALGKPVKLFSFPSSFIKVAATMLGKKDVASRLLDSLVVDISKTKEMLDWVPPRNVDDALLCSVKNIRSLGKPEK